MPRRSEKEAKIIDAFEGVNDAVDHIKLPNNLVSWSHGGFFSERKHFQRLRGKQLNSTATNHGRILDIHTLEFESRSLVVFHSSVILVAETSLTNLVTSTSIATFPMEPFIQ